MLASHPFPFISASPTDLPFTHVLEWMTALAVGFALPWPRILALLRRRRPANISRLVASVIVNPIKRVLRGRRITNFLVERFKRIEPSRPDTNPSARVISFLVSPRRIKSAALHVLPSPIDFTDCTCVAF